MFSPEMRGTEMACSEDLEENIPKSSTTLHNTEQQGNAENNLANNTQWCSCTEYSVAQHRTNEPKCFKSK